ncbi:MAG TPA: cellulase family glycosylhydrolase [Ktedonobacteraceae bacterium]|jgi:hypothetical protein
MSRACQLLCVLVALLLAGTFALPFAAAAASRPALPLDMYAAGPYTVQGPLILDARGRPYIFHGVARDGLEFACQGDDYLTPRDLALLGPSVPGVNGTFWYGNTVRLPLSEAFWLHGQPRQHCTPASYQILVRKTVDTLLLLHLNVILDLQWTDAGGQSTGGAWQLPDEDSVLFWRQMAGLYGGYPTVLFELYNEPHPYASAGDPWGCWRAGCQVADDTSNDFYCNCRLSLSYRAVGMQTLVDTLRQAGARNLVLVGGLNWGYDLSGLPLYALSGPNIVYDTHPYPYQGKRTPGDWESGFGHISATYPVLSAESGEYDCKASFVQRLIPYLDAHRIGWIGWAWYARGSACSFPRLISAYDGTPQPEMGSYIYQALVRYAGQAPRTSFPAVAGPGSGPVSLQWYFPGEPVGEGFSQELILDDASTRDCAVTVQYILQPVRGGQAQSATKTVALAVRALARVTLQVNRDVGVPVAGSGLLVAAIVRVSGETTAGCPGIVAERTVHMDSEGILAGSALLGFSGASPTFFFADVPTDAHSVVVSALSLLNPGPRPAHVTVRYFAAGRQVGIQQDELAPVGSGQIRVPATVPAHVAAVLVADQPVVALRATLLRRLVVRGIGMVSALSEMPGVAHTAENWFFAEGYTGPGFQENLVVANPLGKSVAHLVITLQYANGERQVFHTDVLPGAQVLWDVNAHTLNSGGTTPEIAAQIVSTLPVVSERVLFFRARSGGDPLTGVTTAPGVMRASAVSVFADGYIAPGFDEWLSLQNTTGQRELLTLTLVHAGQYTRYWYYLPAYGRGTISIGRLLQTSGQRSPQGYDVSLIVRSDGGAFVAERPMYWNVAGSQGGSDIAGYSGG